MMFSQKKKIDFSTYDFSIKKPSSVKEALIEMYLASVSVRRMEDITEALWEMKVSSGTITA